MGMYDNQMRSQPCNTQQVSNPYERAVLPSSARVFSTQTLEGRKFDEDIGITAFSDNFKVDVVRKDEMGRNQITSDICPTYVKFRDQNNPAELNRLEVNGKYSIDITNNQDGSYKYSVNIIDRSITELSINFGGHVIKINPVEAAKTEKPPAPEPAPAPTPIEAVEEKPETVSPTPEETLVEPEKIPPVTMPEETAEVAPIEPADVVESPFPPPIDAELSGSGGHSSTSDAEVELSGAEDKEDLSAANAEPTPDTANAPLEDPNSDLDLTVEATNDSEDLSASLSPTTPDLSAASHVDSQLEDQNSQIDLSASSGIARADLSADSKLPQPDLTVQDLPQLEDRNSGVDLSASSGIPRADLSANSKLPQADLSVEEVVPAADDQNLDIPLTSTQDSQSADLSTAKLPPAPDLTAMKAEKIRADAAELFTSLQISREDNYRINDPDKAVTIVENAIKNNEYTQLVKEFDKLIELDAKKHNYNISSKYTSEYSYLDQIIGRAAGYVSGNRLMEARYGQKVADLVEEVKVHQGYTFASSRNEMVEKLYQIAQRENGGEVIASLEQAYNTRYPENKLMDILDNLSNAGWFYTRGKSYELSGIRFSLDSYKNSKH